MISQSKQKGFTIVELLIVIVVIGILAAISIVAYNNVTQKARDDQRLSDARNVINAAAAFQAENGTWPTLTEIRATTNSVVLSGTASTRLNTTAPAPVLSEKDSKYYYQICSGGVRVHYWIEGKATPGSESMVTGTCS